ncbi:MAG: HpcH/HpaI aldolase/citrate lyase family protein [Rhodospirillales bacterium]
MISDSAAAASAPVRPRRSVLYMPGSNARALKKGRALPADGLILDLEDAVAPGAKEQARENIAAALKQGGYGRRELVLRVNGPESPWGEADIKAAAAMKGLGAVLLPKVESAGQIMDAAARLDAHGAPARLPIWCMIETPKGVLRAEDIAAAPRVGCLVLGTSDLAKDMNARHTPERLPFLSSLSHCVLAARAAGAAVLDGVHLDLSDDEGFEHACVQGRDLGMDGKTLIHPKTIAAANRVFAPSAEDVDLARRIIAAHAEAEAAGQGVALLDGRLIENLHVETANRTVALAEACAAAEADSASG